MSYIPAIFLNVLVLVGLVMLRRWIWRFFRRPKPAAAVERCKCGYSLEKLSTARCPECGRVFGFDVTAEELGLTEEQLQRAQSARLKRRAEHS